MIDKNISKTILNKVGNILKKFDVFELGNSLVVYYLIIFFALPTVMLLKLPSQITGYVSSKITLTSNLNVAIIAIVGIVLMYLGYKLAGYVLGEIKNSSIFKNRDISAKRFYIVFSFVFSVGFLDKILRIVGGGYAHLFKTDFLTTSQFYSLIGLLDWLGPMSLAMIFAYYYNLKKKEDDRSKIAGYIAWIIFGIEFCFGFFSGSRFLTSIPVIIYLIVRHYSFKKSFLFALMGVVITFFIVMPITKIYSEYEYILPKYFSSESQLKQPNDVKMTKFDGVQQFLLDNFVNRVDQSRIFISTLNNADIVKNKNNFFLNFFISLGPPRFLWHDKPVTNAGGNEFGREIGILNNDDFTTCVAPTNIGDLYLNFGVWGVVIGMALLGVFARLVFNQLIEKNEQSISGVMMYSIFWIQIIKGSEDWIAPVYAGLVKLLVIMIFIHIALIYNRKQSVKNL